MDYSKISDEELLKLAEENKIEIKKEEIKIDPDNFINGIIHGNSLDVLKKCPDNHFDSVVTDPPYGLSFMGKKWDYDVPSVELWKEVLRVLKPGGHLLSFAGSRTYHRMAVNIEDAGFEIRDQIMWIYGTGFPKSHNIGKAVDKLEGNERKWISKSPFQASDEAERRSEGKCQSGRTTHPDITKGTSKWEGFGTALKPAHEPIVVARKPLSEKTVAKNVLKHGTGGINIDACRIGTEEDLSNIKAFGSMPKNKTDNKGFSRPWMNDKKSILDKQNSAIKKMKDLGRFPANIILDEEAGKILDEQSGISKSIISKNVSRQKRKSNGVFDDKNCGLQNGSTETEGFSDKGGASRFFYCPKASKAERNKGCEEIDKQERVRQDLAGEKKNTFSSNHHPTVKPIKLMEYLIKLVTPPGGVVLDPFAGSGTTLVSAKNLRFNAVVIEMSEEYVKIIKARTNS